MVIGNPITVGGGKIPKPTGDIYNAGTWAADVNHVLISGNAATVTETSSYISTTTPNNAVRFGGVLVGPVRFGTGYTATVRGPSSSYGEQCKVAAVKDFNNIAATEGGGTHIDTDAEISNVQTIAPNTTETVSIDTTAFSGKVGYLYIIYQVFNYSNARTDARIIGLAAI